MIVFIYPFISWLGGGMVGWSVGLSIMQTIKPDKTAHNIFFLPVPSHAFPQSFSFIVINHKAYILVLSWPCFYHICLSDGIEKYQPLHCKWKVVVDQRENLQVKTYQDINFFLTCHNNF